MEVETPIMVEILLCKIFPTWNCLGFGHIDVEFVLNCVDIWIEFGNYTGIELMYLKKKNNEASIPMPCYEMSIIGA